MLNIVNIYEEIFIKIFTVVVTQLLNSCYISRIWIGQGSAAISNETLLSDVNRAYRSLGFFTKIGAKSAKVLGVSLAFESGLNHEQIRILGREKFD